MNVFNTRALLVAIILTGATANGACTLSPGATDSADHSVRDSLGVTIVENGAPALADGWRLSANPVAVIDGNGPVEQTPLDPVSVFEAADGGVLVADGNQSGWNGVLKFSSEGNFREMIGREGQGPGEFRQLWWAGTYRADSIATWDQGGDAISVFGSDGGFDRQVPIPVLFQENTPGTYGFTAGTRGSFDDGAFLAFSFGSFNVPSSPGLGWIEHPLLALAADGERWDTIGVYPFMQATWDGNRQSFGMFTNQVFEAAFGSQVIRAHSETYEIEILERDGTLRTKVRKRFDPIPITQTHVDHFIAWFLQRGEGAPSPEVEAEVRSMLRDTSHPDYLPAFSHVLVDPDLNVWVERFRWVDPWEPGPDPQPTTWDVFGPDGQWLTEILVPAGLLVQSVSSSRIYGFTVDDVDVRHVVVYAIVRE